MHTSHYFPTIETPEFVPAISAWQQENPHGGCLALVAEGSRDAIPTLQAQFRDCGYPLLGGMFPELVVNGEFQRQGVLLLPFQHFPYYQLFESLPEDDATLDGVMTELAGEVEQRGGYDEESALFMIFDGMVPNIATALEKLYLQLADQVHYFGVNAGSETFQPMPCLFDAERYIGGGLLAMLLPEHPGAFLTHNYRQPEQQILATSTLGNRIANIDWRPAFDVYRELVKEQYGVEITRENFYQYGAHFPFGIVRMDGEPLVRIPVALQDDGSLFCVGEVPPNTMLMLLNGIEPDSPSSIDAVARHIELSSGKLLLNFYCAGRRMHLGDAAARELKGLHERFPTLPLMGALSLGEIGSSTSGGYPLFHNATLVAAPWG